MRSFYDVICGNLRAVGQYESKDIEEIPKMRSLSTTSNRVLTSMLPVEKPLLQNLIQDMDKALVGADTRCAAHDRAHEYIGMKLALD